MVKLSCGPEYVCDVEQLAPGDVQRLQLLEAAGGLVNVPHREKENEEIEFLEKIDALGAASGGEEDAV